MVRVVEKLWLGKLVNPLRDRHRPIYNWFPFKEAFSRDLVFLMAETWGLERGQLILDPFSGSGTTGAVALYLGADYTGIELNPEYAAMSAERIEAGWKPREKRKGPKRVKVQGERTLF